MSSYNTWITTNIAWNRPQRTDGFSANTLFLRKISRSRPTQQAINVNVSYSVNSPQSPSLPSVCYSTALTSFWGQNKADGHFRQLIIVDHALFSLLFMALTIWRPWKEDGCWLFLAKSSCFCLCLLSYRFSSLGNQSWESRTHLNGCGLGPGTWEFRNPPGLLATGAYVATAELKRLCGEVVLLWLS